MNNSYIELSISDFDFEQEIYSKAFILGKSKNLNLPAPDFQYNIKKKESYWEISLKSRFFVKNLYLYSENTSGKFSDNYFDLLPGKITKIQYYPKEKNTGISLNFKSMNGILDLRNQSQLTDSLSTNSNFNELFPIND
jgi:hypothetical protein